ncbi:AAA family ATPase [Psychrobacillus sp.]|uniref:ATP-binding protein n=1 Tax=Psychrobacillus sp. TaxID=1871623 RepID=UPI0028BDA2BA|nr:AAA family ATPase [Psychrobacillus sp.]
MIIEKLHIYGFGKHENIEIDLKAGINVFLGENEAGKTSIQQFILHILFGFPQKNAQLLRYEPKTGATYGGKIQILSTDKQRVTIERVKGKASGDVTLYFEDGTRGGEAELAYLLHSYSRLDFEAIFSFSLLQLQGFEKMTEDELTRTLLSSGTTGMDTLSNVEVQFVKEMGELFKPTGKKPLINQQIEELRTIETEWKMQVEEVNKYEPAIKRLKEIEILLEETTKQENHLSTQLQRYTHWKQLKPIKEKEIETVKSLENVQHQSFPADGIRRFEVLKEKETNIKIANEQLDEEFQSLTSNHDILTMQQLESLHSFLAYETEWHQLKAKRIQIEEEQTKTLQSQMQQLALVGVDWEKNLTHIIEADVSIHQEEKLVSLLKKQEQLDQELTQEGRLLQLKKEDLYERQKRIKDVKRSNSTSTAKNKIRGIEMILIGAILIVGFLFSFLQSNWKIAVVTVGICAIVYVGLYVMKKAMQQSNDVQAYENLLMKEQQALQEQITRLEHAMDMLEQEKHAIDQNFYAFLDSYQISSQLSSSVLTEMFNRLRKIQEQQIQLDQMETNLYEVRKRMLELIQQAKNMTAIQLVEDMLFHQLREYYLIEKKKIEEHAFITKKLEMMEAKIKENTMYLEATVRQQTQLLQEAGARTENDYYSAFNVYERKMSLLKELAHLQMQLGENDMAIDDFEEAFEMDTKGSLQALQNKRNELVEERATLYLSAKQLLENHTQSAKLQLLEERKEELLQSVKKWAAYKAVVEAIKQLMLQLKEERLPEVLELAQRYFQMLTSNSYEHLVLAPEGNFEAVKANGQRFKIVELSQATKEQAYISLRIALAISLKKKINFPIIMDDPFVHFDRFRLQQVVQLMMELQKEHQLLYFTCHEKMRYEWKDVHIVEVATLLSGSGGVLR